MQSKLNFSEFKKFRSPIVAIPIEYEKDFCYQCNRSMVSSTTTDELYCTNCGTVKKSSIIVHQLDDKTVPYRGNYNSSNYSITQRKIMRHQLCECNRSSKFQLELWLINEVIDKYTQFQNIEKPKHYPNPSIQGEHLPEKKLVKRGIVKNGIIAVIIYFLLLKHKPVKSKIDISKFMKISISDFSLGENIVREFVSLGLFDLETNINPTLDFIDEYLRRLDEICAQNIPDNARKTIQIRCAANVNFVRELLERADALCLNMNTILKTKIAGAIWLLVCGTQLKKYVKDSDIEVSVENCKKNTFLKLQKSIIDHKDKFMDVFNKYGVIFSETTK